ncbi:MAG: endolytic transglycosylase MltG, partial [Aurantimicrobium sp.]|nr:endolytic transglycosylase MltG [Aurantimicrobium sp.]
ARDILQTMVDRCFQALDEAGVAEADRFRIITMASLIQKEAGAASDFPKVSRVFWNRLDEGMWPTGLLESDATVAYGAGVKRVETTVEERADTNNPYNTYVHPGPLYAPISNPGDVAINAALNPIEGPWFYFVCVNYETGETIFSTTVDEHLAAVEVWDQWLRENPEHDE